MLPVLIVRAKALMQPGWLHSQEGRLVPIGLNHVREENRSPARAVLAELKQGLWFQYNLAELCTILDEFVSLLRFTQRQYAIDYGANLTSLDELHRVEQLGL